MRKFSNPHLTYRRNIAFDHIISGDQPTVDGYSTRDYLINILAKVTSVQQTDASITFIRGVIHADGLMLWRKKSSNVRPCVTGRRRHSPTQQTQQRAESKQTLGIVVSNYKSYPRLKSFRNSFCLQYSTIISITVTRPPRFN
jgi:hypothetical protein